MLFRIGTRNSKLALWQTEWVAKKLQATGASVEIVKIETTGDKIQNRSISKIGSKGVFTEELEIALRTNAIDIAVHSAKDMPSTLDEDFSLLAFTIREQAQDVVISYNKQFKLERADNSFLVGTSSTRRIAMLKRFYPNVKTIDARGNLQTRMKKLEQGEYDALILAYAGIKRMGYEAFICQHLPLDTFVPAVGQGSIAIECAQTLDQDKKLLVRQTLNDSPTEICLIAERSFLKVLQGGCSIPVFGLATLHGNTLKLHAGIISLDGKQALTLIQEAPIDEAERLGKKLAENLIEQGADKILSEIRAKQL